MNWGGNINFTSKNLFNWEINILLIDIKYGLIWFVHTIYIYSSLVCKLNLLILVGLLVQKVWIELLQNMPQICIVQLFYHLNLLQQIIHTQSTICKNVRILSMLSMELGSWTEDDRKRVFYMTHRLRLLAVWSMRCAVFRGMYVTEEMRIKYRKGFP